VRSKYCAAWAASHKHQGYSTCYGVAFTCQQYLDRTPPVRSPAQLLFRFCNRKGKFFPHLGQNIWHKREMGVFALCPVQFFLAHHMQNIESKV
jgi:hypothetical protein